MDLDDYNSFWKAIKPNITEKGEFTHENKYRDEAIKIFTQICRDFNFFDGKAITQNDSIIITGKIMEIIELMEKNFYKCDKK